MTFKELMAAIVFKVTKFGGMTAEIDGIIFSEIYPRDVNEQEVRAWKTKTQRDIAYRASTIILETRCGCRQIVEWGYNDIFRVPLMSNKSSFEILDHQNFSESETFKSRDFRLSNYKDIETGMRLFLEVES